MTYLPFSTKVDGVTTIAAADVNNLQSAVSSISFNAKGYGAAGDGATDDTTEIQAAIDAADAAGGGIVWFPPGTYISTLLTLYSNVHIAGAGIEATTLKLKNSTNTALIQGENFASLTGGDTTGGISDWSVRDMTLDGNIANNATTGYGIRVYGYRYSLRDLHIKDFKTNCIYSEWATASSDNMEARVDNVRCNKTTMAATPTTGALIHWQGPHDSVFTACQWFYGTDVGFKAVGADASAGLMFTNCHTYGDYLTYGFELQGDGCMMNSCIAEAAITANIWAKENNQQFKNCYLGAGPAANPVGIEIDGSGGYSIVGCNFVNFDDGAVKFTSDDGGLIAANYIFGGASDIAFAGTHNVVTVFTGNKLVGTTAEDGSQVTIASGVATLPNGAEYIRINGEGSAADDLSNILPMRKQGTVLHCMANHALTLKNYTGSDGKIITGTGGDLVKAQYSVFTIISDDPNWIVI